MKNTLVIGRCWKFLDFLIPTLDSVYNYNKDVDIIVVDNLSSRSDNIRKYCSLLLQNKIIKCFIAMDKNYFGNVWHINKYLLQDFDSYEYLCFTDLDMRILHPQNSWLNKMTSILARNSFIGAVSVDFAPMDNLPWHFDHIKDHPELKIPQEDFWNINTDGWFYVVRKSDFVDFVSTNFDQNGPGMHGFNRYCDMKGLMYGRTNIIAEHFGWLRIFDEWAYAYQENGIDFANKNTQQNNMQYLTLQGNWNKDVPIPTESSYKIFQ